MYDLKGKRVSSKEFTNVPVTRGDRDGVYVDIGDEYEVQERWIMMEDITEINGKPVRFKVWKY